MMIEVAEFRGLGAPGKPPGASKYNRGRQLLLLPEVEREVNREFGG